MSGAIAGQLRDSRRSIVQAVGMIAVYKMLKATIYACHYMREEGEAVQIIPSFCTVQMGTGKDDERTAIRFELILA